MGATPEGKIKKAVRQLLAGFPSVYLFMPVQTGMGMSTLDFLGSAGGRFFAIETKAPGKHPTDRQNKIIADIKNSGARVFVIDGREGLLELRAWVIGLIE